MFEVWILFAILSGVFVSLREMYIKKFCNQSPEIISFTTRLYGSLIIAVIASQERIEIKNIPVFCGITLLTVVVTAFTTVVRLKLIKEEDLSLTTPWLGTVPLFMVLWCALIYGQLPNAVSMFGILFVCVGAFAINFKGKIFAIKKASILMLLIALLLGLTTSVDKIAIGASSAITYSLLWTILSAVFMYAVAKRRCRKVSIINKHLMVQAVLWVGEFLFQMLAIQYISREAAGPTYVKTLTMLNIVITTFLGGFLFKEGDMKRRSISAILIFAGAVILVLYR